jgi:hypothetical protein
MGLENHNINSGEAYARVLIDTIKEGHQNSGEYNPMMELVINYWCENILNACIVRYSEYVAGDTKNYLLSEEEVKDLYSDATDRLVGDTLETLIDKGDVSMGVRDDGEIVYMTTDQGKEKLKKDKDEAGY